MNKKHIKTFENINTLLHIRCDSFLPLLENFRNCQGGPLTKMTKAFESHDLFADKDWEIEIKQYEAQRMELENSRNDLQKLLEEKKLGLSKVK